MKKAKIILAFIIVLATILGGCEMETKETSKKETYTREEVKQQMLDYLHQKYGEEFDVLDVEYQDWSRNWEKLYAVPKGKGKEYEFVVYRLKNENGDIYYTDDYFIIAQKDKYEGYLKTYIDKCFEEYKISFYFDWPRKEQNQSSQNISFKQFKEYAEEELSIGISIYIPESVESKVVSQFNDLTSEISKICRKGFVQLLGYDNNNYNEYILKAQSESEYEKKYSSFTLINRWENTD